MSEGETGLRREEWATREPLSLHTGEYKSQSLGRMQSYAFLRPPNENPPAEGFPLLVLLHGREGQYSDWPTLTRVARYAALFDMVVAFPDGGSDGWYTNAAHNGERREDDLISDFLPHLQAHLPLIAPGRGWAIGGVSMGGYGAVKIALKHPRLFSVAVSHSGSFERVRTPEVHPVFGDPKEDAGLRRSENPAYLAEQALCRWPTERPRLHIDCGLQDELLPISQRFSDHLTFLGYSHTYREAPGHHTWPYWDRALRTILPTVAHEIGAIKTK